MPVKMEFIHGLAKCVQKMKKYQQFKELKYFELKLNLNTLIFKWMFFQEIMSKNSYPNYYPMSQVIDGAENTTFISIFNDW